MKKTPRPEKFLPSLTIGFSFGTVSTITPIIPMAVLLFSQHLPSDYLVIGIKSVLLSSIIAGLTIGFGSSLKGMLADVSLEPVIATMVAVTIQDISENTTSSAVFFTIIATLSIASMIKGIIYFLVGKFRISEFSNLVPHPIIAGFVTGLGVLFIRSSIRLATNINFTWAERHLFLDTQVALKIVYTILFGLILWLFLKRYHKFFVIPLFIVAGVVIFYLGLAITDTSIADAFQGGWLLGQFPKENNWMQSLDLSGIKQIHLKAIFQQIPNIIAFMIIDVFGFTLSLKAIEKISQQKIDINYELKIGGIANLINGVFGGTVLSPSAYTFTTQIMGFKSRLVSISFVVPKILFLFINISFLSFFPKVVVAGIFAYLGLSLLLDNLYQEWLRISKWEYLLMLMVTVSIATGKLVEAVVIGFVVASIILAVQASQIMPCYEVNILDVNGSDHTEYCSMKTNQLSSNGRAFIFKLEGLIFFGNMNKIFKVIHQYLYENYQESTIYLILDFSRVKLFDSSFTEKLANLKKSVQKENAELLLVALSQKHEQQLLRGGVIEQFHINKQVFSTIESATESLK